MKNLQDNVLQAFETRMPQIETEAEQVAPPPTHTQVQAVNATMSDTVQLETLRVIQEL